MELRIKELCKEKGLRMSDVAEKMGINQANLTSSLNGNPTLTRLKDVAKVLGVEVYELFVKPSALNNQINGLVEIDGELNKISNEIDWIQATRKIGTIAEPKLYLKISELRKDVSAFVHKMVKDPNDSIFLSGRLGHLEIFTLTCYEETVPDTEGGEMSNFVFTLSLIQKNAVYEYQTLEYGIEDLDLDSEMGLIKNITNDIEWPICSMESATEFWD